MYPFFGHVLTQLEAQMYMKADMANVMPKASLNAVCSAKDVRMRDDLKRSFSWRYCAMSIPALAARL